MSLNVDLYCADCIRVLDSMGEQAVDLIFGSPPYEDMRSYDCGFCLVGQDWVDGMVSVTLSSLKVCRGLVAFVVDGRTRDFRWSATPALLMADLHRAGVRLRRPAIYHRHGMCGSGGPDWLRNDYEFIVCCAGAGRLPWSDTRAMGKKSYSNVNGKACENTNDGKRRNARTGKRLSRKRTVSISNPGNVISCYAKDTNYGNEAPFRKHLADFFICSFCPTGGVALDPFCGSGTTCVSAVSNGRNTIGIDCRMDQISITKNRLLCAYPDNIEINVH